MKEHIKAVVTLTVTLVLLNAVLDIADMFGFSMARQLVNSPLSLFIKKPAAATAS